MSFPPPPESTNRLDSIVTAAGDLTRPSNTKWDDLKRWVATCTELDVESVYPAWVSRQSNFKVRLEQRGRRARLGFAFLNDHSELDSCVRSARRITGPDQMYDCIAVCSRPGGGPWTVTAVVHGQGEELSGVLRHGFPAAGFYEYVASVPTPSAPENDVDRLADELFVDRAWLRELIWLLRDKKGLVLYGPPGTGKTFIARRIAAFMQPDPKLRALVQLHPSYGYEDFFEGYRPAATSRDGALTLERTDGPLRLLHAAVERAGKDGVLVLDEMNRANLPKVFGELFFALEYRKEAVRLMYDPTEAFVLGDRLLVLGTMNTADRSIAVLDQALRRRFHFVPLFPGQPIVDGIFERFLAKKPTMRWLSEVLAHANELLGDPNVAIGPSHFMREDLNEEIAARVWRHSVMPTIEEHFFGDRARLAEFRLEALRAAVQRADRDSGDA